MESISLSYFVDYMLTSGTSRITSGKFIRQGPDERYSDFYRPVREAIVDMHAKGLDTRALNDFLATVEEPREKRIFPKIAIGYGKFLRQYRRLTWFEPPLREYPLGPVSVRVNPELGLLIDGRPHALKMYFRGEPLYAQRAVLINELLHDSLASTWPGTVFGVLDVRRAKLFTYQPRPEVNRLLRAEAASLGALLTPP